MSVAILMRRWAMSNSTSMTPSPTGGSIRSWWTLRALLGVQACATLLLMLVISPSLVGMPTK